MKNQSLEIIVEETEKFRKFLESRREIRELKFYRENGENYLVFKDFRRVNKINKIPPTSIFENKNQNVKFFLLANTPSNDSKEPLDFMTEPG